MNAAEFELARGTLSSFILCEAAALAAYNGAGFLAHPTAPDTFDGILNEYALWSKGYPFRVSPDNCDNIIYTSAEVNHAFRFWHDVLHAHHGNDLTFQGEMAVAAMHIDCAVREFGADSNEVKLMQVDTVEQLIHFREKGKHVDNQLQFAKDRLITALPTFHAEPMSVDGVSGYALQRSHNGTVKFYGDSLGIRIMSYAQAQRIVNEHLADINHEQYWLERDGAHSDSKKPVTGLPSGYPVWSRG